MEKTSLKKRLLNFLRKSYFNNPNIWVHKGYLEDRAKQSGYLGETAGRQLRELVEEHKIETRPKGKSQELRYLPAIDEINKVL